VAFPIRADRLSPASGQGMVLAAPGRVHAGQDVVLLGMRSRAWE
jgi:hypothetical protein